MPIEPTKISLVFGAILGGVAVLLDTVIGTIIFAWADFRSMGELVFGISFLLAIPMYLIDLLTKKRIAFCLAGLFLLRWAVRCLAGPTPGLVNPFEWPSGTLLFAAFVLLQWSKLRKAGVSPSSPSSAHPRAL